MRTHIKVVGVIHVVYNLLAVLTVVAFVGLWIGTSGAIGLGTTMSGDTSPHGGAALSGVLSIVGLLVGCGMLVPSLPGFLGGIGCLRQRPWSRVLLIVVSALHVLTFVPIGIGIGAYSLWVLLQPETKAIFEGYDWIPTGDGPASPPSPTAGAGSDGRVVDGEVVPR